MDFRKINFGRIDAQTEGQDFPELLRDGYIDNANVVKRALESSVFLFLGYKGSGKSSLSEHLRLTIDEQYIIDQQGLKDFSFKNFSKIIPSDDEMVVKAKNAWRWLLAIKVLNNLHEDSDARSTDETEIRRFISTFSSAGLFPVTNISSLVKKTSTTSFKAQIKSFEFTHTQCKENTEISFTMAINYVRNLLCTYKESHKHIIIIDDVDDILTAQESQFVSIAALINEVKDLNRFLRNNGIPVKIIVLCRTDIFDRLNDPNKNKIKQDNSYEFTWYKEGIDKPSESRLIELANKRSRLVYPHLKDVFVEFFPGRYNDNSIYNSLLDFTRHTPRDFIQLLNSIQKQCTSHSVTAKDITNGVKEYSTNYFISEIRDEMAGYINSQKAEHILGIFSSFHKREFTYNEFLERFAQVPELNGTNPKEVMRVLYDCSAIGHIYSYDGKNNRYTFKYRNPNSAFIQSDKITLHKGLWKSLNVNF